MDLTFLLTGPPATSGIVAIAATFLRIGLGLAIAYYHGWHKLADGLAWRSGARPDWPFADEVKAAGFPLPVVSAWLATAAQLCGGLGLIFGLLTLPSAILLGGTLLGAVYTNLVLKKSNQLAFLYLLLVVGVGLLGPGRLALEHFLFR